jgi:NADPH:quinone reductase-like Zn-dependent oxidoreductase
MSNRTTRAIWLGKDGQLGLRTIEVDDRYKAQGTQTLVQVEYSAVNPADIRHFFMGLSEYVAGYEWVGTAIETGPSSPFKVGQQLFGMTMAGNKRPIAAGVHQDYLLAESQWTHAVPTGIDPKDIVSFPVGARTSIDALFNQLGFALPAAGVSGVNAENEAILIWGGGSIVGQAAVQLAKAAGFSPIIATASAKNHDFLKRLGATHTFDYRSADIVEHVRSVLGGKKLRTAYDAVAVGLGAFEGLSKEEEKAVEAKFHLSSPAIAMECCDKDEELKLTAVLPVTKAPGWKFMMPYRVPDGAESPKGAGLDSLFEDSLPEWGNRMEKVLAWILDDFAHRWQPHQVRVVKGAEAGIPAIQDVFAGKAGGEKVVIEHPM